MRLSELKPGMKVIRDHWSKDSIAEVLFVGKTSVFIRWPSGGEIAFDFIDGWLIVEPRKKPSERIQNLIGHTSSDPEWQEKAVCAIIDYLDECAEKADQ